MRAYRRERVQERAHRREEVGEPGTRPTSASAAWGGKGAAAIFGISLVIVPWLTVITAGPSILVMLLLRNVVLGAAFGFILLNILLWVTGQGAEQVGLCLLLTLLVTGTYVLNVREHILSSIKARQWRELFLELAG